MSSDSLQLLLEKAYESIENDDLTAAMEATKEILNTNSEHPHGLEIMGYLLLELNCLEEAKFYFTKSIENGNNANHTSYLYLGQLTSGEESVAYFLKSIEMMKTIIENKDERRRLFTPSLLDVSNGYVSLSEIYMTDLCDNADAEEKCREYISKAIEEDSTNPAPWQSLASLNLIKNDKEESKINITKSLNLWLPAAKKIMSDADNEEEATMTDNEIIISTNPNNESDEQSQCTDQEIDTVLSSMKVEGNHISLVRAYIGRLREEVTQLRDMVRNTNLEREEKKKDENKLRKGLQAEIERCQEICRNLNEILVSSLESDEERKKEKGPMRQNVSSSGQTPCDLVDQAFSNDSQPPLDGQ